MSRQNLRNCVAAAVMAFGTMTAANEALASDCRIPRYYWKTVISYETVRQPVQQWVTQYDHCGKPYRASDVLAARLDADPFLEHLADHAEEFLQRPRANPADLERQIAAFRRSCDALLAAPLPQLDEDDRTWLKDRCRVWVGKFDSQLAALKDGARPWQDIRGEADATVKTLATALRERKVS